ncbi:hypothetical protein L596_009972 [Steinernema carpocapsae]|uniref:Uncharacterized protein n=1 Tax=Steinernema carpocapsae TaxID=34508 RepID=A0A4U5PGW7_STECR|nr:hypothetical protein L596_009972 [Steinernema carpocapsae]
MDESEATAHLFAQGSRFTLEKPLSAEENPLPAVEKPLPAVEKTKDRRSIVNSTAQIREWTNPWTNSTFR